MSTMVNRPLELSRQPSFLVVIVLAICVMGAMAVGLACASPKTPPPPCTGYEVWPDPCYGVTAKTDAGH